MTSVIEAAKTATTTKFVLVPSHHDAHHKFIYPTPPFPNTQNEEVRLIRVFIVEQFGLVKL